MAEPTIYDILNWQQDWGGGTHVTDIQKAIAGGASASEISEMENRVLAGSGQAQMSGYLSDLLGKSGTYDESILGGSLGFDPSGAQFWHASDPYKGLAMTYMEDDTQKTMALDMEKAMSGLYREEDFTGMSRAELENYIQDAYSSEFEQARGREYTGGYSLGDEDEPISAWASGIGPEQLYGLQQNPALQREALYEDYEKWYGGLDETTEEFLSKEDFLASLTGNVGFTESGTDVGFEEGDMKAMLDYAQAMQEGLGRVGSITERFDLTGQLGAEERDVERAGTEALAAYMPREIVSRYGALQGGGTDAGEASEAQYLGALGSAERRRGRNVRSIYGELEDEMFSGIGKWLENVTS